MQTIELDCAPDGPRPVDLIEGVLYGSGLPLREPIAKWFALDVCKPGHSIGTRIGRYQWTWDFTDIDPPQWVAAQAVTEPRIRALHHAGHIRYGSW